MIGNLSGLKAVVFLWQFVGRDRRESPAFLLFMTGNDNYRHCKNSKATNPAKTDTVCPPIAQKRRGQLYEVSSTFTAVLCAVKALTIKLSYTGRQQAKSNILPRKATQG